MPYAKKIIVVIISVLSIQFLSAQNNYVTHTLKQGESLSMLAQEYNTSVGDIMRLNGMHADAKLVFGSSIKIPSTKKQVSNAKTESNVAVHTQPVSIPANTVTHTVVKGETLFSISKKYNVSLEQLKTWNHLTGNNAKLGTVLVIGNNSNANTVVVAPKKQRVETVTASEEKTQPATSEDNNKLTAQSTPEIKTETVQPASQTENNSTTTIDNSVSSVISQPATDYKGIGYFASQFQEKKSRNMKNVSGISKTFKTASGWNDGKYYILANDIEPGTIVKITADNGNAVYAKVLWNMGDMKENAGIDFRVSNATASALYENASSFNVNVSY